MVHHRMLPLPRWRSDDRAGCHGSGGSTARHRPSSGGGFQHRFGVDGERRERNRDCSGTDRSGSGRNDRALPTKEEMMGEGTPDVEYGKGEEGDKVSDRLPLGD